MLTLDDRAGTDERAGWEEGARAVPQLEQVRLEQESPLLEVCDLRTFFVTRQGVGKAVDGVSFCVQRGETLGIVGESGCGKSVTALSILRLVPQPAGRIVGGRILFDGLDMLGLSEAEMRKYRGGRISMVLQDPVSALNPIFNVGWQIEEPLRIHRGLAGLSLVREAMRQLQVMRIPEAASRLRDYPHQFSGGMRQRIVGAIALSCNPDLLIADEPTTSLDATTQLAYMKLLKEIQAERKLAIIFITHDLGIVAHMCDRVAVMYAGKVVELGTVYDILEYPAHPYTQALLDSVPTLGSSNGRLRSIEGQPPSIYAIPPGCPFASRCIYAQERCRVGYPPESAIGNGHTVSCWRYP